MDILMKCLDKDNDGKISLSDLRTLFESEGGLIWLLNIYFYLFYY